MIRFYFHPTPNPAKVALLLEEAGLEYELVPVDTSKGEQHLPAYLAINPNGKVPAIVDTDGPGGREVRVFDSNAILLYLAEKFGAFLPSDIAGRAETMNWLFWQMGSAPMLGGGFGHFYAYAPEYYEYPINRYTMEVKRQLDVLDRQLANNRYIAGDEYTIADMAIWPWYGALVKNKVYDAAEFLEAHTYTNVIRWADEIAQRPAVRRGRMVNRAWGEPSSQLHERHDASDFETQTQDKIGDGE